VLEDLRIFAMENKKLKWDDKLEKWRFDNFKAQMVELYDKEY
jgi:hypothetical protein